MSASSIVLSRRTNWLTRAADFVELTKPKIGVMVLLATAVAYHLACWGRGDWIMLLHTLCGTGLVAASASAINQLWERHRDARMNRTTGRPLPAGRLTVGEVLSFAVITIVLGSLWLGMLVDAATLAWALASWVIYGFIYTPLKTITWLNTVVGAVSGALPVCIGWSAGGGEWNLQIGAVFTMLFLWQFPHFMAIAWLYRDDYRRGGFQMLTVVDASGTRAGWQAVSAALVMVPVSMLPVAFVPGHAAVAYLILAMLLGMMQLFYAVGFFASRSEHSARMLLRASLVYLPTLLVLLSITPWI